MTNDPSRQKATPVTVLKNLPDLVFEFSPDGHYLAFHGGPEHLLYSSKRELMGAHISEALPQPAADQIVKALDHVVSDGQPRSVRYALPQNRELRYYDCHLTRLESGNCLALVHEVTETWHAQTALEQSEEQFRALARNIPGIVYRCEIDEDWTAVYISAAVADILGYPADDFIAHKVSLGSRIHPEDRQWIARAVDDAVRDRSSFDLTYRMITADGQVRRVHERGRPVYAEYDEALYVDGVIFDVTDIHRMRQRVLTSHKMAAVGNLAAGVAHEINNPLAIIMANLEYVSEELAEVSTVLREDSPVLNALADVGNAITKVQSGTDRVRSIIDDLRAFSDAAEGHADQIDPRRLVSWAIQRFDVHSRSPAPHLVIDLQSVSPIWASEVAVVQIVWNLLENAFDAAKDVDPRTARVEIRLFESDGHVHLEVVDNGKGMTSEVARRAFEPFFTTKLVGQGVGLGLFVCQGLLEGMDGEITFETKPGQGTRVQVICPTIAAP